VATPVAAVDAWPPDAPALVVNIIFIVVWNRLSTPS
jgi:hypothetical protein